MPYYPMALNVEGWGCLIVGGGKVALKRAVGFAQAGADVMVVSPTVDDGFATLEGINLHTRAFLESDLEGMFIAVAATDDADVNRHVAEACEKRGILVNVVDDPARCQFIVPATVERGGLQLSIHTGGSSPAFTARLRKRLDGWLPQDLGEYLIFLEKAREHAKHSIPDAVLRTKIATHLASTEGYAKFCELDETQRNQWLGELMKHPGAV